jgi:hypothetical protein
LIEKRKEDHVYQSICCAFPHRRRKHHPAPKALGQSPLRTRLKAAISASCRRIGTRGDLAMPEQVAIVLFVTALDTGDADEEYLAEVEVSAAGDYSDAVTVLSVDITSTGNKTILVSRDQVLDALDGAGHMRLKVTPSGTTPSIDFWAMLSPIVGR